VERLSWPLHILQGDIMRAALYERTGAAGEVLEIRELPDPIPAAGEVRVKIAFSGVNPSDVKSRRGSVNPTLSYPYIVPHSDGSGVIDRVGPAVDPARVGQRVWVRNAAWGRPHGTAAEYVVLPERHVFPLPPSVDFAAGACLGIPALTAWHAVNAYGGVTGKSVLVAGGAGAVGHYAVQFARLAGASRLLTTVSTPEKEALAREAGADLVINYRSSDVATAVLEATDGKGVERIIEVDLAANITTDLKAVRNDGEIVVYGSGSREIPVPFGPSILKNVRYNFFIVYNLNDDDLQRAVADITRLLERNQLQHNIAETLPLEEIARAHELVESGKGVGNVVLRIS
jgi:NADPH2:quinone reductase